MEPQINLAFRRALQAARQHEGATAPNPAVGCVLLDRDGVILAEAGHAGAGQPHAEAAAIAQARQAGLAERIHTVVVTLEPCAHHGRTGPCTSAILSTPARLVCYGMADPNPVATGGAEVLARAGLTVRRIDDPDLRAEAARLLAPFASRITRGRPFVTVKQALRQGSMIPPPGQKTFTSPPSLTLAHRLRRRADAILTGSGTILADRPEFTVRHLPDIPGKSRPLCILDRRGRVDAAYLAQARARGFLPRVETDLGAALTALAQEGCNEVLVEAGPALTAAVEQAGLWDEWVRIETPDEPGAPDKITFLSR